LRVGKSWAVSLGFLEKGKKGGGGGGEFVALGGGRKKKDGFESFVRVFTGRGGEGKSIQGRGKTPAPPLRTGRGKRKKKKGEKAE